MKKISQKTPGKFFIVHAFSEAEAIQEVKRQSPESHSVHDYNVVRIHRTFWQKFANRPPRWKVSFDAEVKREDATTS